MDKIIKKVIAVLGFIFMVTMIYLAIREVAPYDDTKKLYITCQNQHKSYDIISDQDINFAKNNDKCGLEINIRNVERHYLKLKVNRYFYSADKDGKLDEESSPANEIYVEPDKVLILYSYDNKTKFEFEYK